MEMHEVSKQDLSFQDLLLFFSVLFGEFLLVLESLLNIDLPWSLVVIYFLMILSQSFLMLQSFVVGGDSRPSLRNAESAAKG